MRLDPVDRENLLRCADRAQKNAADLRLAGCYIASGAELETARRYRALANDDAADRFYTDPTPTFEKRDRRARRR
jgi:hypothetical protein